MYSNEGSRAEWQRWGAQSRSEDGEWHHNAFGSRRARLELDDGLEEIDDLLHLVPYVGWTADGYSGDS